MEKRYGATERNDRLMHIGQNKWELIYGYGTDGIIGWDYRARFTRKPTNEDIKDIITEQINHNADERILSGMRWNGIPVWLSAENQFNYKAAYDLAVQSNGTSLPAKFKFGTDEKPVYHTFKSVEELQGFYTSCIAFIQQVLEECWAEKDNLDLSVFNKA